MANPFPISSAIDALVESDDFEEWIKEYPFDDEIRRILIEAIAQIIWFRNEIGYADD